MCADVEALGRTIKQVQWRHHRALDSRLREVGSTLAQWDALRAIGNLPGASAHELALATFQSDQAFGTLANRLEARELIERRQGRGRRIQHRLTRLGESTLADGRRMVIGVFDESFGGLSQGEREQLQSLLDRVGSGLREYP